MTDKKKKKVKKLSAKTGMSYQAAHNALSQAPAAVTASEEKRWSRFTAELLKGGAWQCFAPRSGFADKAPKQVYKLLLRPSRRTPGSWWYFEDEISRVPSDYVRVAYADAKSRSKLIEGPIHLLAGIEAEVRHTTCREPRALKRVLVLLRPLLLT